MNINSNYMARYNLISFKAQNYFIKSINQLFLEQQIKIKIDNIIFQHCSVLISIIKYKN